MRIQLAQILRPDDLRRCDRVEDGDARAVSPPYFHRRTTHMTQQQPDPPTPVSSDALFTEVYDRLKAMASRHRARASREQTLCTTEIVHELYLRMEDVAHGGFADPLQFFAYAARAMRSIMVDMARQRQQMKRGAGLVRVPLDESSAGAVQVDPALALTLDAALGALENDDARAARVVELHFFAGLSLDQVAGLLGVSTRTVDRDWQYARAFLAAHATTT
jgi:RNA polymerase sigma factor (TIGR02999 family)